MNLPKRILLITLSCIVLFFAADTVLYWVRSSAGTGVGKVHRTRMLAIPQKNGKVEFQIDSAQPEEDVPCVHTLLPHRGMNPCWYVTRHAHDPVVM